MVVPSQGLCDRHAWLCDSVNNGGVSEGYLRGWRAGVDEIWALRHHGETCRGMLRMDADMRLIDAGYDGEMCGGLVNDKSKYAEWKAGQ